MSRYAEWLLGQGTPLYETGGQYWRRYQGALIPVAAKPLFLTLDAGQAAELLAKSGALFLRYTDQAADRPTDWWDVICDEYNPEGSLRQKVNRGRRKCSTRQMTAEWLAQHGYECYLAAFSRYKGVIPDSETAFREKILCTEGGPFEYWGVFVEGALAGYCQVIVDDDYVNTSTGKFHPDYLKDYCSYTLTDALSSHYVCDRKMSIYSGSRSILHVTNYQDYLRRFGYRKLYSRLRIIYRPYFKYLVQAIQPLQKAVDYLPKQQGLAQKLRALLAQEAIRRRCMS